MCSLIVVWPVSELSGFFVELFGLSFRHLLFKNPSGNVSFSLLKIQSQKKVPSVRSVMQTLSKHRLGERFLKNAPPF